MTKTDNLLFLSYVKLKNFRAYAGDVDIDLSLEPTKTITIIQGNMGDGKTTLLNAIYWCLYEKERYKKAELGDESIINSNTLKNLEAHDEDETLVQIFLNDSTGTRYKITRGVKFSKESTDSTSKILDLKIGGNIPDNINYKIYSEFDYKDPIQKDWIPFTKPENVTGEIEKLFPEALSSYFLFDAELLDDFYVSKSDEHVKNGIEKISGLPILDNLKTNLKNTVKEIEKSVAVKDVQLDSIRREKEDEERDLNKYREKLIDVDKRLTEIDRRIKGIKVFLEENSASEIRRMNDQLSRLDNELKDIKERESDVKNEIKKMLLEATPRFLLKNVILEAENRFRQLEDQGEIPLAITKTTLDNILNSTPPICICGTAIQNDSPQYKKLIELSKKVVDSAIVQELNVGRAIMAKLIESNNANELLLHFKKLKQKRLELTRKHTEIERNRDETIKTIAGYNKQDIPNKIKQLSDMENEQIELIGDKRSFQDKFDKKNKSIRKLEAQLQHEIRKEQKYQFEQNKMKIANKIITTLEEMRDELVDKIREETAGLTTKHFHKLVSKADDFSRIEITSDYEIIARGHDDESKSPSSGQSVCLALSYIAAIREIAQKNYFMMIDSPLLKISDKERNKIAQDLPAFLPNTQVILLIQDQERDSIIDTLRENKSIIREYILENKKIINEATTTTIKRIDGDQIR